MKSPSCWTLDIIDGKMAECYCCINWEYNDMHPRFVYALGVIGEKITAKLIVNKHHNASVKKPRKPLYCQRKPSAHCYENKCPHFASCDPCD